MGIFRDLGQSILRTFDAGKTDEAVWTFPKKFGCVKCPAGTVRLVLSLRDALADISQQHQPNQANTENRRVS
jgi:hypothetical protein